MADKFIVQVSGYSEITEESLREGYTQFELDRMNASRQRAQQRGKGSEAIALNTIPVEKEPTVDERDQAWRSPRRHTAGLDGKTQSSFFNRGVDMMFRSGQTGRMRKKLVTIINNRGLELARAFVDQCPHVAWIREHCGDLLS